MAFIRVKNRKFNGKEYDYAYLVENKRGRFGPRQSVIKYLGKIFKFEVVKEVEFKLLECSYKKLLVCLFENELKRCGFELKDNVYVYEDCSVDLDKLNVYGGNEKNIVLQINAGFVCEYSLKELFNLKFEEGDDFKKEFAKKLVLGGLDVKPEIFVELYRRLMIK